MENENNIENSVVENTNVETSNVETSNVEPHIICSNCGCEINEDVVSHHIGTDYYCDNCFNDLVETEEIRLCADCGEYFHINDLTSIENTDDLYCENCLESNIDNGEITRCEECEEYYYTSDMEVINDETYICNNCVENCLNNGTLFRCDDCDCLGFIEDGYTDINGRNICDCCRDEYVFCENCGQLVSYDDAYEHDGEYYCENCYDSISEDDDYDYEIGGYHSVEDFMFNNESYNGDDSKIYMGFELEVENTLNNISCGEMAHDVKDIGSFYTTRDGSLDNGFEIISNPCEYSLHSGKLASVYKELLTTLVDNGFRGDETNTCGLHIHVSRKPLKENTIEKIQAFMETYKDELVKFARRNSGRYTRFLQDCEGDYNKDFISSIGYLKDKNNDDNMKVRYRALNLCNSETIEFRLFRSTLNYETFMATLNFVYNLVMVCNETEKVEDITFDKVVGYNTSEELKGYIARREIATDKKIVDKSREYINYIANTTKLVNKISRKIDEALLKIYDIETKIWRDKIINDDKYFVYGINNFTDIYSSLRGFKCENIPKEKVRAYLDSVIYKFLQYDEENIIESIGLKLTNKYNCLNVDSIEVLKGVIVDVYNIIKR